MRSEGEGVRCEGEVVGLIFKRVWDTTIVNLKRRGLKNTPTHQPAHSLACYSLKIHPIILSVDRTQSLQGKDHHW